MSSEGSAAASSSRTRWRAVVVSFAVLVACIWILKKGGLPLLPAEGTLSSTDPGLLVGFTIGMGINQTSRFARFYFLLAPIASVPFRRVMTVGAIGNALVTFLPFRLGEVARPAMLREEGRVSAWAVTGAVAAERILDGVAFSGTLLLGLWLATPRSPIPDHVGALPISADLVPRAAQLGSAAFGIAFLVMLVFYRYRVQARRVTERVFGLVSVSFGKRVADIVERLSDGFAFLVDARQALPFVAVTLVSVVAQVVATDLLAGAVGLPDLSVAESMVLTGVVALGFAMPNAPGFFGTIQLALYAGLASYVAPERIVHEGAALVFLFYSIYMALVVAFALMALAGGAREGRKIVTVKKHTV